ncbi:MAG: hypothetical protein AAGA54_32450 [Myxococcota bacterium]
MPADGDWPAQSVASMLQSTLDRAVSFRVSAPEITDFLGITDRGYRQHVYTLDGEGFTLMKLATEDLKGEFKKLREKTAKFDKYVKKFLDMAMESADHLAARSWRGYRKLAKLVPATYSFGFFHIKYLGTVDGEGPPEPPWEAVYGFGLIGLKAGKSAGDVSAKIEFKGEARPFGGEAMRPEDLVGFIEQMESTVAAAGPGVPKTPKGAVGGSGAALAFLGDLAPNASRGGVLTFILTKAAKPKKDSKSGGGAASLKGLGGWVWLLDGTKPDDIEVLGSDEEGPEFKAYWEKNLGPMQVFFPINGAHFEVPTEAEREQMLEQQRLSPRQALEAFAAAELPLMMHPLAVFKLEGFADAPGGAGPNSVLSTARAATVTNYVEALLGESWTGGRAPSIVNWLKNPDPPEDYKIIGLGKGEVSNSSDDFNQADRRVDLYIRVEPPRTGADEEKRPSDMEPSDAETTARLTRQTD